MNEHVPNDWKAPTVSNPFWEHSTHDHGTRENGINASLPGGFWNDLDPIRQNRRERPLDRRIAELNLQGFTNIEIAHELGLTTATVSNSLRQPAVRAYMTTAVQRTVADEMKSFLDAELMPSLQAMKDIRDNPDAKPSDRLAAAEALTNRRLGRPTQPITNDKPAQEMSQDELNAKVQELLRDTATA